MEITKKNKSLWLVTCSDLFFLLFAFFVLNHTLPTKNPGLASLKIPVEDLSSSSLELSQEVKPDFVSTYEADGYDEQELIYEVNQGWFGDNDELTILGKTHLQSIDSLRGKNQVVVKIEISIPDVLKDNQDLKSVSLLYDKVSSEITGSKKTIINSSNLISDPAIHLVVKY